MLRTVAVTRYVTPLREGGSVPAIVEADDSGMYVLKFRGAGQGPRALVAEVIAGEIARAAGLPVPEIVLIELDPGLARTEPDPELQDLIRKSGGLNVALDYLPGAVMFDPVVHALEPALASQIVWFDAFITNVDRTARNTNMLMWHRKLQLIDHGASLYFHHAWDHDLGGVAERSRDPFALVKDHVLLPYASKLDEANARMTQLLTPQLVRAIVGLVPDLFLSGEASASAPFTYKEAYVQYLLARLAAPQPFVEEAIRAHVALV